MSRERPVLDNEQKAHLIYEIMLWAIGNTTIQNSDAPKADIFKLLEIITNDNAHRLHASASTLFVQQLKKSGELWDKIRPFLENSNNGCLSSSNLEVETPFIASYHRKCGHGPSYHIDGKCTGTHSVWQPDPTIPAGSYYSSGKYVPRPCACTQYRTNQKW